MKKSLIGAIVGAIIIFIWQFLSFAAVNLHKPAQQHTDKEKAIMEYLNSQGLADGGYILPSPPEGASSEQQEAFMKENDNKPWAMLQYHQNAQNSMNDMIMNMVRVFLVNTVILLLFIWILRRMAAPTFGTIVISSLFVGLISFFHQPYTGHIWYKTFDIWAFFADAIVIWGLVGLWLGWWLRRDVRDNVRLS